MSVRDIILAASGSTTPAPTPGKFYVWGSNNSGQGGWNYVQRPVIAANTFFTWLPAQSNFTKIAQSDSGTVNFTYMIREDGSLWVFTSDDFWSADGAYGSATLPRPSTGTNIWQIGTLTNWAAAVTSSRCAHFIKTDGTLWGVGTGASGILGTNDIIARSSPVQIGSLANWSTIVAGNDFRLALKTDGTLWGWGTNAYGQVGNNLRNDVSSPVQIGGLTWNYIAANAQSSLAVRSDNTLWAWGRNNNGQLGLNIAAGSTVARSSPVQVGTLANWSKVFLSGTSAFAIKTDGTLWAWGLNSNGQLGINNSLDRSSPVQVGALTNWTYVMAQGSAGNGFLNSNNQAFACGAAGTWGNDVRRSSPVQVSGTYAQQPIGALYYQDAKGIVQYWSIFALTSSNQLTLWGRGDSTAISNFVLTVPALFAGDSTTNWTDVAAGGYTFWGIRSDGTLWSCGNNGGGGLGVNIAGTIDKSSPVQVGSLTNWKNIWGGGTSTNPYAVAIKTDGTLWAWGNNNSGQLGDNTVIDKSSPIQVGALTNWSLVGATQNTTAAIKTDGTLWTWGANTDGLLGLQISASTGYRSSPVQVGGLTWKSISTGGTNFLAVRSDGTLWAWGSNSDGQLGINQGVASVPGRSSPVQVGTLTNWATAFTTSISSFAIKTDGTLWAWGYNQGGRLGDGTIINRSSPVQIGSLTTWTYVGGGNGPTVAIQSDGSLWGWGSQINGYATGYSQSSPVQIGLAITGTGNLGTWVKVTSSRSDSIAAIKA